MGCEEWPGSTRELTQFERDDHEPYFPIESGDHAVQCASCHGGTSTFKKFTCLTCHEEQDTSPSHSSVSGYVYESAACYACHPTGEAGPSVDHGRIFPIDAPGSHDEVGCSECHTGFSNGTYDVNACASCHVNVVNNDLPTIHNDVGGFQPDLDLATQSIQCKLCHADSQIDRMNNHGPFLVAAGQPHYQENCLQCHDQRRDDKDWAADFAAQNCLGCHEETPTRESHVAVAIFDYTTGSCLTCHPDGSAAAAAIEHESRYPILPSTKHGQVSCAECHINATNIKEVGCRECHAGTRAEDLPALHLNVGEFQLIVAPGAPRQVSNAQCKSCHAESQVDPVGDHSPFLINAGQAHYQKNCLQCHDQRRGDKDWAADFTQKTCLTCHEETPTTSSHSAVPTFVYATSSCLTCHPDGERGANGIEHGGYFPIAAPAAHDEVSCAGCHIDSNDITKNGCMECHTTTLNNNLPNLHVDVGEFSDGASIESVQCKMCHADSQINAIAVHGGVDGFQIGAGKAHFKANCLTCHDAARTDKTWAADFTKKSCLTCHAQTETNASHNGIGGYSWDTTSCLLCHPGGEAAPNVDHAPIFPIAAGDGHQDIGCVECHVSTTWNENKCRSCHENEQGQNMSNIHNRVGEFRNGAGGIDSNDCKQCHGDAQINPVSAHVPFRILDGQGETPHNKRNCLSCHQSPRNDKTWANDFSKFSCSECHRRGEMNDKHSEVGGGYSYNDFNTCLFCHANGMKN